MTTVDTRDHYYHWEVYSIFSLVLLIKKDLDEIKRDVKTIYDNQIKQTEVLSDIISITNVSRTLINENREKINGMIHNIESLQESLKDIKTDLRILFTTRKFLLIHAEILIHSNRLRVAVDTLKNDKWICPIFNDAKLRQTKPSFN